MYTLDRTKQLVALSALSEGMSIRATGRLVGAHRDTIMRLGVRAGEAAIEYSDRTLRDLPCRMIQLDEQWSFVFKKQRRLAPGDDPRRMGDFWIWSAICADTRAVPTFRLGKRDAATANDFVTDVAKRMRNRVQVSADGLNLYVEAIERAFGGDVDFGQVVKSFEAEAIGPGRYGPPRVSSVERTPVVGKPAYFGISTSRIERLHLANRMRCRRLTRLVDSFSRKAENLRAAIGLTYFVHNFVRRHGAHRLTPAQALGVARNPLTLSDLLDMTPAA